MRIFAGEKVKAVMGRLNMPEGEAIEAGMINRSIESAQRKVEAHNFDIRKQLLEFDDVANDQRQVIYQQRNEIIDAAALDTKIAGLRHSSITDLVRNYVPTESVEEQWDLAGLERQLTTEYGLEIDLQSWVKDASDVGDAAILERVMPLPTKPTRPNSLGLTGKNFISLCAWFCYKISTPIGAIICWHSITCGKASICVGSPRTAQARVQTRGI